MTNGNGINVRKRDGSLTPLNLDKIHKVVDEACEGLGSGVSASAVEMNSDLQFFDGIQTKDIHEILIKSAKEHPFIKFKENCSSNASRDIFDALQNMVSTAISTKMGTSCNKATPTKSFLCLYGKK